jgi:ABC-type multidrug transport system fused ATPase/permease subunit
LLEIAELQDGRIARLTAGPTATPTAAPVDQPVSAREALRMVRDLISPREARRTIVLLVCMLVTATTEVVGIAGLLPLVSVVTQPQIVQTNAWLAWLYALLGFQSVQSFIIFLGAMFLALYVLTYSCSAFTYWLCLRFSVRMSDRLSTALLASYLRRPYAWLITHNSTDLTRSVLDDSDKLVERFILRGATMVTKAVSAVFICAALLWINPLVALTTSAILSSLYVLIYRFFERRVDALGKVRSAANAQRYKAVVEALGAVKEARCLHGRRHFLDGFRSPHLHYSGLLARQRMIGEYPRYFTETLAVAAIVCVLLFLVAIDANSSRAFPLIGLYIMATWRLVPALQTVYSDLVEIQFYMPLLRRIHADLAEFADTVEHDAIRVPLERDIRLRAVSFTYPDSPAPAVHDVTIHIPKDAAVALVGATGSGKSTLADILTGHLTPQAGAVEIDGRPLDAASTPGWQHNVGYVPQDIYIIDDTIRRNVALGLPDDRIDDAAVERACRTAGLHDFITQTLERGLDTVLGERGVSLSGGQRQRIGIARALYHDPQVLLLDEATSALDNRTEYTVMQAIQELAHRKTLIVIAHRLTTVEACDRVYVLEAGTVVGEGTFVELLGSSDHLRALARPDAAATADVDEAAAIGR